MDTDRILDVATNAARDGGEVLMKYLEEGVQIRDKSSAGGKTYDLVSDADIESEKVIAARIRDSFPDHELMGEEDLHGDASAEHLWIIDPLDGTNNFAHRIPHFAVSIAYYHRGQPIVAVVFNPSLKEWFTAVRGHGAFRNGVAVRVSEATSLAESLIGCGFYYDRGEMMRRTLAVIEELFGHDIHGLRRLGTASLDLCYVGCGHFGGFFEYQLSPWDFAAGVLFVQEAGGSVSDARGETLALEKSSVLASNDVLHEQLTAITQKHHP